MTVKNPKLRDVVVYAIRGGQRTVLCITSSLNRAIVQASDAAPDATLEFIQRYRGKKLPTKIDPAIVADARREILAA